MKTFTSVVLDFAFLLVLALTHSAQGSVWVIDSSGGPAADFTSIQGAIASATVLDGDVLLVKPGTYSPFSNSKALTIQSDSGGAVIVNGTSPSSISGIPSGKSAHLRGLTLNGLGLYNNDGSIWVEQCTITAPFNYYGVAVYDSSDVALIRCSARGEEYPGSCQGFIYYPAGGGLHLSGGSTVHSYGCRFEGGAGGYASDDFGMHCYPIPAGAGEGVRSTDSLDRLFFSDCEIVGGESAQCGEDLWGSCTCPGGGVGLHAQGKAALLDSTVTGGAGAPENPWGPYCGDSPPGPDYLGTPRFLPGRSLGVTTSSPLRENEPVSIHIQGPPHVPVLMGYAAFPESTRFIDLLRGVMLLPLGPATGSAWVGITDANGVLDLTLPPSPLPPDVESSRSFLQFAYLESPDLPRGFKILEYPAVPKTLVLGEGTMFVTLDEQF